MFLHPSSLTSSNEAKVGRPIVVVRNLTPSLEEMKVVQGLYIKELLRIWEEGKDLYAKDRKQELRIVS